MKEENTAHKQPTEPEGRRRCVIFGSAAVSREDIDATCVTPADLIVCADGGLRHAQVFGVPVHALIGDGDSGGVTAPEGAEIVRLPTAKDCSDTQVCIDYGLAHACRDFWMLGCVGGPRLDHFLGNIALMSYCAGHGAQGRLIGAGHEFLLHTGGVMKLPHAYTFRYVSVFPLDEQVTGVTLTGLTYPLRDAVLLRGVTHGLSNEPTGGAVVIRLTGRAVVVLAERR